VVVVMRCRAGTKARHAEGHHPEATSGRPGSPAKPHHGSGSHRGARTQAAQAHGRQSGTSVRIHDQPGRAVHQQRVEAASAPPCDLPQGDQWVPLRVGRRDLCRLPLRRRHREAQWCFSVRRHPVRAARQTTRGGSGRDEASNYENAAAGLFDRDRKDYRRGR
jgi:hypothetical protein